MFVLISIFKIRVRQQEHMFALLYELLRKSAGHLFWLEGSLDAAGKDKLFPQFQAYGLMT